MPYYLGGGFEYTRVHRIKRARNEIEINFPSASPFGVVMD